MPTKQGVWGIDIGQCALKALRLEQVDGVVTATAFDYVEHPKILSQPDADPDQLTREALETFLSRNTIKGDQVAMSIAGQSGLARFVKLPPVEERKIADIVRFEAKQQIPFPLDEVVWDFQKINAGIVTDGFAMDTEIGLFAMKRDMINRFLHHFQSVKVEVHIVQMSPLALCNYVAYDLLKRNADGSQRGEAAADDTPVGKKRCAVALDIGTDGSSLIITDGERIIWQRPIPIGGNHFTRALTKELKLTFAKAEHLKRNAAKSPDLAKILKALKPVLSDFVNEVQRSLGYFTNTHRDAHVAFMVGLGSAFRLPGLQKFLSEKLQLDVRKPTEFEGLAGDEVVGAPVFTENLLTFSVAYGLCLQGLNLSRLSTNLLPQEIQFDRMIRAKKPYSVAAAAAMLLGVGVLAFGFGMRSQSLGNPLTPQDTPDDPISKAVLASTSAVEQAGKKKTEATTKQGEITNNTRDVKSLVAGTDERPNWIQLNEFISRCLPQPDGKNLLHFDKNDKPVNQKVFWTTDAQLANEQYQMRRLGTGNVVDLPLDDQALQHLVNIDVESIYPLYVDDLKEFYTKAKEKTQKDFGDALTGIEVFSPPAPAKRYSEEFPTGKGWVVEIRGTTYNKDYRKFLIETLVFNLNYYGGIKGLAPFGSAGSGAPAGPMAGSPPAAATPGATAGASAFPAPIDGRVSHAFLYFVRQVDNPVPGQFVNINQTHLDDVIGGSGAGGGGAGPMGGFGPMGPMGAGPMGAGVAGGGPAIVAPERSGWQPISSAASGGGGAAPGAGIGGAPGVPGPGAGNAGAAAPGLPGAGAVGGAPMGGVGVGGGGTPEAPKPGTRQRTRYEFVVMFTWREPVGLDKDGK